MPNWKRRRLENYDCSQCGAYFVTICTIEKYNLFWKNDTFQNMDDIQLTNLGEILNVSMEELQRHYPFLQIDNYVIMPNHIHLIMVLTEQRMSLSTIINQWKGYVTRKYDTPVFQPSFHDHIIRDAAEYEKIWKYIEDNPRKWNEDKYYLAP